jgi:UDP-N-acetylglucosamine--N-acetylmuramyl-(pentapeptide) pyrophosphoryl-undecaprenol N-acetylglucosamine transferase
VLIPYPHATADHQRGNAEALVRAGAAVLLDDEDLSPETLAAAVEPILTDPDRAGLMSLSARAWSRPAAAEALALLALTYFPESERDLPLPGGGAEPSGRTNHG